MKSLLLALLVCIASAAPLSADNPYKNSVVMISNFAQSYLVRTPWRLSARSGGSGSGVVIKGGRVLTNAHVVSNSRFVMLKKATSARRYPARVEFIGHDCDLAVLVPKDPRFFEGMVPLELGGVPEVNKQVEIFGFPFGSRGGYNISVTRGIVSRVGVMRYVHSNNSKLLLIQTDAAINPGNSGGPAIQDGRILGVAFQGNNKAENVGYLIPTQIVRHFLKDIEDGRYDGFSGGSFTVSHALHNENYRDFLKVPQNIQGVVITQTLVKHPNAKLFKRNDVLYEIDGLAIDHDGLVQDGNLRCYFTAITDKWQIGETAKVKIWREGKSIDIDLPIRLEKQNFSYERLYDKAYPYLIFAGLSFVELNMNYMESYGAKWFQTVPRQYRFVYHDPISVNNDRERDSLLVLSEVMTDDCNYFSKPFLNSILKSVNGKAVKDLKHLDTLIKESKEPYLNLHFLGSAKPLTLELKTCRDKHGAILGRYQITQAQRLP